MLFSEKLTWKAIKKKAVTLHSSSHLLKVMELKELLAICRIRPLGPFSSIAFSGSQIMGFSNNSYKSFTKTPNNFLNMHTIIT